MLSWAWLPLLTVSAADCQAAEWSWLCWRQYYSQHDPLLKSLLSRHSRPLSYPDMGWLREKLEQQRLVEMAAPWWSAPVSGQWENRGRGGLKWEPHGIRKSTQRLKRPWGRIEPGGFVCPLRQRQTGPLSRVPWLGAVLWEVLIHKWPVTGSWWITHGNWEWFYICWIF